MTDNRVSSDELERDSLESLAGNALSEAYRGSLKDELDDSAIERSIEQAIEQAEQRAQAGRAAKTVRPSPRDVMGRLAATLERENDNQLPLAAGIRLRDYTVHGADTRHERLELDFGHGNKAGIALSDGGYTVTASAPKSLEQGLVELTGERNHGFTYEKTELSWQCADATEARRVLRHALVLTNFTAHLDSSLAAGLGQQLWYANDVEAYKAMGAGTMENRQYPTLGRDPDGGTKTKPFGMRLLAVDQFSQERDTPLAGQLLAADRHFAAVLIPRTDAVALVPLHGKLQALAERAQGEWVELAPTYSKDANGHRSFRGMTALQTDREDVLSMQDDYRVKLHDEFMKLTAVKAVNTALDVLEGRQPEPAEGKRAKGFDAISYSMYLAARDEGRRLQAEGQPLLPEGKLLGMELQALAKMDKASRAAEQAVDDEVRQHAVRQRMQAREDLIDARNDRLAASALYLAAEQRGATLAQPDRDSLQNSLEKVYVLRQGERAVSDMFIGATASASREMKHEVAAEQVRGIPSKRAWQAVGRGESYKGASERALSVDELADLAMRRSRTPPTVCADMGLGR